MVHTASSVKWNINHIITPYYVEESETTNVPPKSASAEGGCKLGWQFAHYK